ncbi:transposable element Tcb2 transposase [Trichonephila clavipes]|nr:transposable element Tcb2 transposase [Trichonephila clavipes]
MSYLWKQFQDTGSIEEKPGKGRPRPTMAREDRHLPITARRNGGATASELSRYSYAAIGTRVSRVTGLKKTLREGCLPEEMILNTDSRRTFTWREPGTRYLSSNVHEIDNYGGGLMVWTGMFDGRTSLNVFERGSVTDVVYREERGYSPYGLASQVSRPQLYRIGLERSREGNCNSQPLSENHPGNENNVAERVDPIVTRTYKTALF